MYVKIKAKVRGRKEKEVEMYVNSFADYSVLPTETIKELSQSLLRQGRK
jgi:hypothetical protein